MKVNRRIVIDIASGRLLGRDHFDYSGLIAEAKSTTSTTTTNVPPPTPEESQAKDLANQINLLNLKEQGYDAKWIEDTPSTYDRKGNVKVAGKGHWDITERALTPEEQAAKARDAELEQLAYNRLKGVADPETQKLVDETFQGQREAGNEELKRFLSEQAAARGMSVTDTPLLRELGLQKGNLETQLRGAQSAALLDVGQRNQIFAQALREFQTNLRQQAFLNRAGISESAAQTALGLGRLRTANTSSSTSTTTPFMSGGQAVSAGVGAASAIASAAVMM